MKSMEIDGTTIEGYFNKFLGFSTKKSDKPKSH